MEINSICPECSEVEEIFQITAEETFLGDILVRYRCNNCDCIWEEIYICTNIDIISHGKKYENGMP